MNFLEANKILKAFSSNRNLEFSLAMSGQPEKLDIFLKASAAKKGFNCKFNTLPFNTLQQIIITGVNLSDNEVFVLLPWDFAPEADWRMGISEKHLDKEVIFQNITDTTMKLKDRSNAKFIYIPAPIPPLFFNRDDDMNLERIFIANAYSLGSTILSGSTFSMASYLDHGNPFSGSKLGYVAREIINKAILKETEPCKLLVTDLDNVIWNGVIGEDGQEGIDYGPSGKGYKHFIYQSYLKKIKNEGSLLAAVSRNDDELARQPFKEGKMILVEGDFVSIIASYNAKSSQIIELANQLNLDTSSFVFVDDNPIELEEVSSKIPNINCVLFPKYDDELIGTISQLSNYFSKKKLTREDLERTKMYQTRLKGMVPSEASGSDLTEFLTKLNMSLTIHDRSIGDLTRAIQLINKTNQFNLNGIRVHNDEVEQILTEGGSLITAELTDNYGKHGEILSCLIDNNGVVHSFVLSCRVFQRRIEYAFLNWLINSSKVKHLDLRFKYLSTERNIPAQKFIEEVYFIHLGDNYYQLDKKMFNKRYGIDHELFKLNVTVE